MATLQDCTLFHGQDRLTKVGHNKAANAKGIWIAGLVLKGQRKTVRFPAAVG